MQKSILVSACLMGLPCRWHGKKLRFSSGLKKILAQYPLAKITPVCPEMLGDLPTPRPPVKRRQGRVYRTCAEKSRRKEITGKDVTESFDLGAQRTLQIAKLQGADLAVFCKWSPSCDVSGITGKLLCGHGIEIINTF